MSIPQTVGKYNIVSVLGIGGMGTVYRAFDPTLERTVALKILKLAWMRGVPPEELATRFRIEARAVARLNHPAIVTIFDYDDQDPAGAYIAMEYVDGCALDQYIKKRSELHLEDAISTVQQMLGGLAYAHRAGVVHRDIKPPNLLITRDGLVKIMDFGIAKIGSQNQTQSGMMMGTPWYMAPEQYLGGVVDHRCDIHAAGAVLYELLTGSAPYLGTDVEVMHKVCHEKPKPLSTVDPSIAEALDPIIAKALEKIPDNRYASATDFAEALRLAWQAIASKPLSLTLSESARVIATAVSQQPVVLPASGRASPGDAPATHADTLVRPAPVALGAVAPMESLVGWSRDQLAEIERQLMPIVGPVARILVRDAAATTASRQELYQLLASNLRTPEERRLFLRSGDPTVTAPRSTPPSSVANTKASTTSTTSRRPTASSNIARRPLTEEVTQRAGKLLARYLGPIATVVARKAAQTAADEAHLYSMLAEKLTDVAERERFLREAGRPH